MNGKPYTPADIAWLTQNYRTATTTTIERTLHRPMRCVTVKACKLGLKRQVIGVSKKNFKSIKVTVELPKTRHEQRFMQLLSLLVKCKKSTKLPSSGIVDRILSDVHFGRIDLG